MKIGLYGGIANNMYVFAQSLVREGQDIVFIRDRSDRFVFSQPVWEDISTTLPYEEIVLSSLWTWEQWTAWETELGWVSPLWLKDPFTNLPKVSNLLTKSWNWLDKLYLKSLIKHNSYLLNALSLMREVDALLVCGIEGAILAFLSEKLFIILPHGGDIRTAVGLHSPTSRNPKVWLKYWLQLRLLRNAYQRAICVASHDPLGIGGHIGNVLNTPFARKMRKLPIPVAIRQRLCSEDRRLLLTRLLARFHLSIPDGAIVGFIPSRLDYYWKGQDQVLRAYQKLKDQSIVLIFAGWGQDYKKAKEFVIQNHLQDTILFLPCSLSKPLLYDFFQSADFVIDQLLMGTYGTSALEAMSCGCPVMMWINEEAFFKKQWQPPPVINVKTEVELISAFENILQYPEFLKTYSAKSHQWIAENHSDSVAVSLLLDYFRSESNSRQ